MNTMFLKSDLAELALLVEKLKEAESVAEKWAAGEDNITDKYAYKYGVMLGRTRALADAFQSRLDIINKTLVMGSANTAEKPKGIEFLASSGYYDAVLNDVKGAATYDDAILALVEWFNDLDRSFELGPDYEAVKVHAVLAYSYFDKNGML